MPGRVVRAFACFFEGRMCTCMSKPASGFRVILGYYRDNGKKVETTIVYIGVI